MIVMGITPPLFCYRCEYVVVIDFVISGLRDCDSYLRLHIGEEMTVTMEMEIGKHLLKPTTSLDLWRCFEFHCTVRVVC